MQLNIYRRSSPNTSQNMSNSFRPLSDLSLLRLAIDRAKIDQTVHYVVERPELWALYAPIAVAKIYRGCFHKIRVIDQLLRGEPTQMDPPPAEWKVEHSVEICNVKESA